MCCIKGTTVSVIVLATGVMALGVALVAGPTSTTQPAAKPAADPAPAATTPHAKPGAGPAAAASRANAQARLKAARRAYEGMLAAYKVEATMALDTEYLFRWSHRWAEAQLQLAASRKERLAAVEAHLDRMKRLDQMIQGQLRVGVGRRFEGSKAEFYRLDAEDWLARVRAS
jgi:hypothetical protein